MAQGYNFGIAPLSTFDDISRFLIDQFRIQFDDLNYLRWFLVFILFRKLFHVGLLICNGLINGEILHFYYNLFGRSTCVDIDSSSNENNVLRI